MIASPAGLLAAVIMLGGCGGDDAQFDRPPDGGTRWSIAEALHSEMPTTESGDQVFYFCEESGGGRFFCAGSAGPSFNESRVYRDYNVFCEGDRCRWEQSR
jgi:hypothetical protein